MLGSILSKGTREFRLGSPPLQEYPAKLRWTLIFLVISMVAGVFGFAGISVAAAGIAKILFFIFIVIFLIFLILGLAAARRL